MTPAWWFRLLRAAVFSAVCVVLSAGGHEVMSGARTPVWALATGFLGVLGLSVAVAGRQCSQLAILAGVEAAQLGLHPLFAWSGAGVSMAHSGAMPGVHAGMAGAHAAMPGAGAGTAMILAHAIAGALAAGWLHAGEVAAWRALSRLAELVVAPLRVVLALAGARVPAAGRRVRVRPRWGDDSVALGQATLRYVVARRGPPGVAGPAGL